MEIGPETNLEVIKIMRGEYLRSDRTYDKWGAMGKVLLAQVLIRNWQIPLMRYNEILSYIQAAFPREFSCAEERRIPNDKSIIEYYFSVKKALLQQEMEEGKAEWVAAEETAECFCVGIERIRQLIDVPIRD